MRGPQRGEGGILELRGREAQCVRHRREQGAARRRKGAGRPRVHRNVEVVSRGARLGDGCRREGRLVQAERSEELGAHRVFPGEPGDRLDRAARESPADIRIRPGAAGRLPRRDLRGDTCQHIVALAFRGRELEVRAQRDPRAIGEQVAHGCLLCPAGAAELRHVRRDGIVQREAAGLVEASDERRRHRLRQGAEGEARLGRHRLARRSARDAGACNAHLPVAEDAERGTRHRVAGHVFAEQAREVELAHCATV